MGGNRIRAAVFLVLAACAAACGQATSQTSNQNSPPSNSAASQPPSSSRRSHHVQVADDDTPAQPTALSEAEAAIEKKDYAAAERLLNKVVDHDAKSYVAWFDLGFVENELGNLDASIAAYRKSVSAKPDVFESNLNLGLQLAKTAQPDAERFLRAATTLKPTAHVAEGQYRAWMALGDALQKSKPEEAVEAYRQAATLQPGEAEPHISAGALFEAGNKSADAEQEYKRALALNPQGSDAAIALANLYMRGRRFPEAEEYLRKISAENPQSSAAEIQLGRVLAAEGKNDDAIAAMAAGIQLNPADEAAKRELADLYATMGKNDLAEAAYRELLRAHPKDAELHDGLGRALLWQKKSAEAVRELEAALTLKPDLGNAYYDLAFAANDQKNYSLVIGALDRRGRLLPETPMTYFLRASAYDHLRDFKNAAANFHLFLKVANGKYPDQEWQAKHRLIAIEPKR